MAKKYAYYLVTEDGDVLGTNERDIVRFAGDDGITLVIDIVAGTTTFDGNKASIEEAKSEDWRDDEDEDEDDEEAEEA